MHFDFLSFGESEEIGGINELDGYTYTLLALEDVCGYLSMWLDPVKACAEEFYREGIRGTGRGVRCTEGTGQRQRKSRQEPGSPAGSICASCPTSVGHGELGLSQLRNGEDDSRNQMGILGHSEREGMITI